MTSASPRRSAPEPRVTVPPTHARVYEIHIEPRVDAAWIEAWTGLSSLDRDGHGTVLAGVTPDRGALTSVLCRLHALKLDVVAVRTVGTVRHVPREGR